MTLCTSKLPALSMLLVAVSTLTAQSTTGALRGKVTDASGRPLSKTTILLRSPALFQPRPVRVDAQGEWRAPLLPVGNYDVLFSCEGFLGKTLKNVRVGLGSDSSVDATLQPIKTIEATVEVVETLGQEAKTADKVSVNFSAEKLLQLPAGRTFSGALFLTPGVSGESIRGAGASQTGYTINGIDVKSDASSGSLYEVLQDSIEDIQVVTSAANARYGKSTGGFVNMVTKTGSNTFSGTIRTNVSRPSWDAAYFTTRTWEQVPTDQDNLTRDWQLTFSGPIIPDRFWFSIGTRLIPDRSSTARVPVVPTIAPSLGLGEIKHPLTTIGMLPSVDQVLVSGPGSGYGVSHFQSGEYFTYKPSYKKVEGKLTFQISPSHTLQSSLLSERNTYLSGPQGITSPALQRQFIGDGVTEVTAHSLGWKGLLSDSAYVEVDYSYVLSRDAQAQGPRTADRPYSVMAHISNAASNRTDYRTYSPFVQLMNSSSSADGSRVGNRDIKANLRLYRNFVGEHEIDLGLQRYRSLFAPGRLQANNGVNIFTGGYYVNSGGEFLFPTIRFMGANVNNQNWVDGAGESRRGPAPVLARGRKPNGDSVNGHDALYVNDTWSLNAHWNLMLGLRYNKDIITDTDSSVLRSLSHIDPRVMLKWDPAGTSTDVFNLSVGRYASNLSTGMSSNTNYGGTLGFTGDPFSVRTLQGWTGAALAGGQQPIPGALNDLVNGRAMYGVRFVTYNDLANFANYDPVPYLFIDARQTKIWEDVKPPMVYELSVGWRHNSPKGWVSISATQRVYRDRIFAFQDYGFSNFTLVKDPTGAGAPSKWQQVTFIRNDPFRQSFRDLEISWEDRPAPGWTWGGAITYRTQDSEKDPGTYYQYKSIREQFLADPARAYLGATEDNFVPSGTWDRGMSGNAHLTYVQPLGKGQISLSLMATYSSGSITNMSQAMEYPSAYSTMPTTREGLAVSLPANLPYTYHFGQYGSRISGRDTFSNTFKIQWQIPLVSKLTLVGHVQFDNIWNSSRQTYYTEGTRNYTGAPAHRAVYSFTRPWGSREEGTVNQDNYQLNSPRSIGACSIGLKF